MRKRALAAAAAMLMLAAVVANLLMLSTTAQPIEQDEAVAEKLTQTYVTHMPEPVIRQEEPERDMSAWTDAAAYIAKTVYGEAMVCGTTERAAVVWCILNRADDARDATPAGVIAVVTKPYQFHGYAADHPLLPELEELALDVIERWLDEKDGKADTGRVLPREYLFFSGDGKHNHFRTEWDGGQVWDWSLQSPYTQPVLGARRGVLSGAIRVCDHGCQRHGAGHAAPHGQDHAVPEGAEVLRELPNAAVKTHAERTQEHTCVRSAFSAKLQLSDTLFVVP